MRENNEKRKIEWGLDPKSTYPTHIFGK